MFNKEELETLYYACAQAEMMWRHRSNNPEQFPNWVKGEWDFEATCREQMKRYREMQKQVEVICEDNGCFTSD